MKYTHQFLYKMHKESKTKAHFSNTFESIFETMHYIHEVFILHISSRLWNYFEGNSRENSTCFIFDWIEINFILSVVCLPRTVELINLIHKLQTLGVFTTSSNGSNLSTPINLKNSISSIISETNPNMFKTKYLLHRKFWQTSLYFAYFARIFSQELKSNLKFVALHLINLTRLTAKARSIVHSNQEKPCVRLECQSSGEIQQRFAYDSINVALFSDLLWNESILLRILVFQQQFQSSKNMNELRLSSSQAFFVLHNHFIELQKAKPQTSIHKYKYSASMHVPVEMIFFVKGFSNLFSIFYKSTNCFNCLTVFYWATYQFGKEIIPPKELTNMNCNSNVGSVAVIINCQTHVASWSMKIHRWQPKREYVIHKHSNYYIDRTYISKCFSFKRNCSETLKNNRLLSSN